VTFHIEGLSHITGCHQAFFSHATGRTQYLLAECTSQGVLRQDRGNLYFLGNPKLAPVLQLYNGKELVTQFLFIRLRVNIIPRASALGALE